MSSASNKRSGGLPAFLSAATRSSLVLNLFSVSGSSFLAKVLGLITIGYAARILGPANYGLVGFGASLTAYAGIVLMPGMLVWGTREIARDRTKAGEVLMVVNLWRILFALVAYAGLYAYARYALASDRERMVVLLCGLALFSTALAVDWVFNGLELMRVPAWISVGVAACNVIGLLTLVRTPSDIRNYALLAPATGLLSAVVGGALLTRRHIRWHLPSAAVTRKSFVRSIPLGIMVAFVVILHYTNNLIVKSYLGIAALGIFMASFALFELVSTVPNILGSVFLPRLSAKVVADRKGAVIEAGIFAQVHMTLGFFFAAILLAEAPGIISLIYGAKYATSANVLRLMSVGVIFNFAICGYTNCLIAFGRDRVMILVVIVSAIVAVGGGLLVVPRFGVLGAACVIATIDLVGWLVSLPHYRSTIGSLHLSTWGMPALGAACMIIVSLVLQRTELPFLARLPLMGIVFIPFVVKVLSTAAAIPRARFAQALLNPNG